MLSGKEIVAKAERLKTRYADSDQRYQDIAAIRRGNVQNVAPDLVSDVFPRPVIANFVDVVARDVSEMIAPLPAFNCSSASMQSDAARKAADKRSKIAQHYVSLSDLATQMQTGADHYVTYGLSVGIVEPDMEAMSPRIVLESPVGGYVEWDRWGRVVSYVKRFYGDVEELQARFPEHYFQLGRIGRKPGVQAGQIELIRYIDKHQVTMVAVASEPIVLSDASNPIGVVPVAVAKRPWLHADEIKGQFDDVIWVQVARDYLAKLQLEATEKAVQAPMALPDDVQELGSGPDAIIRSTTPEKIRRVGLEISNAGFSQQQILAEEMREGTRYPNARTGGVDGSIVTGRGVQALMGGFDTQIKTAQLAFQTMFTELIRICFTMDERLWSGMKKSVRGSSAGTPYDFTYTPERDINGDHSVDVTYGFASGLDPNRATVLLLQLRAEKAISRDYFRRQLPFDLNVSEEETKVDAEEAREALKQSIYAYAQALPALAQSGQDPAEVVARMAAYVSGIQKGMPVEKVVADIFAPQAPLPAPGVPGEPGGSGASMGAGGGPGGSGGGLTDSGLMKGVPQGQAGMAPGGRPDLNVMLAGLTNSGQPQMSSFTMRRRRV